MITSCINIGGGLWFSMGLGFPSVEFRFVSSAVAVVCFYFVLKGFVMCWVISFPCTLSYYLPFVVDVVLCSLFSTLVGVDPCLCCLTCSSLRLLCGFCGFIVGMLYRLCTCVCYPVSRWVPSRPLVCWLDLMLFTVVTLHRYFTAALRFRTLFLTLAYSSHCSRVSVWAWALPVPSGLWSLWHLTVRDRSGHIRTPQRLPRNSCVCVWIQFKSVAVNTEPRVTQVPMALWFQMAEVAGGGHLKLR